MQFEYGNVIEKVRHVVKKFRKKPKRLETLRYYIKEDKKVFINLILDCRTRWSSMANMIQRFLDLKSSIVKASIALEISFNFSKNELQKLKELCDALSPIKATVEALFRREINLIAADGLILNLLTTLQIMDTTISQNLCNNLIVEIRKRRTIMTDALKFLHTGEIDPMIHAILNSSIPTEAEFYPLFEFIYKNTAHENSINSNQTIENSDLSTQNNSINFADSIQKIINESMSTKPKTFLNNSTNGLKLEITLFKKTGNKSKNLSYIYNSLLSIKPSSVECERTFSTSGYLNNALRNQMSPNTLDILVFLRYYFQNKN